MRGYTMIEIMIAVAIIVVITAAAIPLFSSLGTPKIFDESVSSVLGLLSSARSKSVSQVKPASCGSDSLTGYKIVISASGSDYEQDVVCGSSNQLVKKSKLPANIIFDNNSTSSILFDVSTGSVTSPGEIIIKGYGKSSKIIITKTGNISIVKQ